MLADDGIAPLVTSNTGSRHRMNVYRFHDYLEVIIDAGDRVGYARYFENEYARITARTDGPSCTARIQVRIVDQLPDPLPGTLVNSESFKRLFRYRFAIEDMYTNDVKIYFKSHPVHTIYPAAVGVYLQAHLLEPIMYLKLLEQGILFMHGAGVSKNNRAYIFPAQGGTGKTSLSINLVGCGYRLLGDDLLMVDSYSGTVFPYQRPLHIFDYNIRSLRGAHIPIRLKAVVYAKNVLRVLLERALKTEFLISTRVHADQILPDLALSGPCPLAKVFFLKKTGPHSADDMTDEQRRLKFAREIIRSGDLNQSLYPLVVDQEQLDRIQRAELDAAERILLNAAYVGWLNARSLDLDDLNGLISVIER